MQLKKVLSIATAAAMAMNIASVPFHVFAEELAVQNEVTTITSEVNTSSKAKVSKFSLLGSDKLSTYNSI